MTLNRKAFRHAPAWASACVMLSALLVLDGQPFSPTSHAQTRISKPAKGRVAIKRRSTPTATRDSLVGARARGVNESDRNSSPGNGCSDSGRSRCGPSSVAAADVSTPSEDVWLDHEIGRVQV